MIEVIARFVALLVALLAGLLLVPAPAEAATLQDVCPDAPGAGVGRSFAGQTLAFPNFSRQDLRNANFEGATLQGAVFIGADLTGANFRNARFVDTQSPMRTSDFSFATLDNACFNNAVFSARTYFSYASLSCTGFAGTDIRGNAIFGTSLNLGNAANCRTSFQRATMSCEFIGQWNLLDLSQADITACGSQLATPSGAPTGHVFSGGIYSNVVFDGLDLSRSVWSQAKVDGASFRRSTLDGASGLAASDLTMAQFTEASLKGLDLSSASLYGSVFDRANLDGASLRGAWLSPCPPPGLCGAASLRGAFLRNVDLSGSHLVNTSFVNASFYTNLVAAGGSCSATAIKGQCATARGATMTNTDFTDAYLFGVDFSSTTMLGAIFDGAVLVGADFSSASIAPEPNRNSGGFTNAFLQGAKFAGATIDGVTFTGAFFDFRSNGNTLLILLNSHHTLFAGWSATDKPVCTRVTYDKPSSMPLKQTGLTCPDTSKATASGGCGPISAELPSNSHWNNGLDVANNDPAAGYTFAATFSPAAQKRLCERNLAW